MSVIGYVIAKKMVLKAFKNAFLPVCLYRGSATEMALLALSNLLCVIFLYTGWGSKSTAYQNLCKLVSILETFNRIYYPYGFIKSHMQVCSDVKDWCYSLWLMCKS